MNNHSEHPPLPPCDHDDCGRSGCKHIPPESDVRAMRDRVFGCMSSDRNWEGCKAGWMKPEEIAWLRKLDDKKRTSRLTE
jgi:hypothetical protein